MVLPKVGILEQESSDVDSYFVFAKESDLIIPVCDCPLPVCVSQSDALLVDVQILTNTKSEHDILLSISEAM